MALPDAVPEPEDFESSRRGQDVPPGDVDRPDWLVGADDGILGADDESRPTPRLVLGDAPARREPPREAAAEPPKPRWKAAASSVPRLTVVPSAERKVRSRALPGDDQPTPADVVEDSGTDIEDAPVAVVEPPPPPPHDEPFWLVWAEALATHRPLQIGVAVATLVVLAVLFWPRHSEPGVSLGEIRRHPERYESRPVRVSGEVGDVFAVGRGYVYHLVQSGDSVVVFTSGAPPRLRQRVAVSGTVSTGYLDGLPRVAIFETPASP